MLDFLKSTSSTDRKIRTAINEEPLGPYNKELLELSALTHNRKALATITSNLQKKLAKAISNADSPKRSYTIAGPSSSRYRHSGSVHRSSTVHSSTPSSSDYRKDLGVLKCLTVIVHLCQNGSREFSQWAKQSYMALIYPLGRLSFHPKTANAIYSKVELIIKYCENDVELKTARHSLDQMRSELRPGPLNASSAA
ncbi:hypothetical protein OXX59_004125 [Metschnikowia pulcherrima]